MVEGAPAPVGEHALSDGKILVVTEAGKVAQIKEASASSDDEDEVSKMKKDIQMLAEAVQTLMGVQSKAQVETTEAITKSFKEEISALKAEIKTGHRPSTKTLDQLKAAGVDLKKLASDGVEIFFTQVFHDGFFHADMHPGNIFVSVAPKTFGRYIALDFGIVGALSDSDKNYLAQNFLAFFNRNFIS